MREKMGERNMLDGKAVRRVCKIGIKRASLGIFALILFFLLLFGGLHFKWERENSSLPQEVSELEIKNRSETVESLRGGLHRHAKQVTVNFTTVADATGQIEKMADDLMEEALAETDSPVEGDYIRFQYGGYEVRYSHEKDRDGYHYTVRIIPDYYTYFVQEEQVNEWVAEIMESFHFTEKTTEYEKVRAVYDYVCRNVAYDEVHREKKHKHLKTTAYAALKYGAAVCQGYAVLVYRLLREAGVSARVIEGYAVTLSGKAELHAWNLVKIGNLYYNLDVTLDKAENTDMFFLKSDRDFPRHVREKSYRTAEFCREYPVAEESFDREKEE